MMADPLTPNVFPAFTNVLVLVGLPAGPTNCALSKHVLARPPEGVTVNLFDNLARLPRYSEAVETHGPPRQVIALRQAAAEADAVLVVTAYRGHVPSVVQCAIDWLTRRWHQGGLHDKPLAVIRRSNGHYSGVWSHQIGNVRGRLGSRVIEPLTVATLCEAVRKLADEVHSGSAAAAK
jgi:NAD(P)H-dependent FMN reductase